MLQLFRTQKTPGVSPPFIMKSNLPQLTDVAIFDTRAQPDSELYVIVNLIRLKI